MSESEVTEVRNLLVRHVSLVKHMQEFQHVHWPRAREFIPHNVES